MEYGWSGRTTVYDPGLGKKGFARDLLLLRFRRLRLTQARFADRFGLSFGAVKDQEQSRVAPSRAMKVLVAAIEMDPEFMARAAAEASRRWG
jgi:transcriptional regulator with XRE-family HTH domain